MSRIEKTFRCPKDGRAIARIEVSEQKRWLVRLAGRDGHAKSLASELAEVVADWRSNAKVIVRQSGTEFYFKTLSRLVKPKTQVAEKRQELPSDLDIGLRELEMKPMPYHVACPKCHAPYALTIELREDGTSGVLVSEA